jgi:hypothetical protein
MAADPEPTDAEQWQHDRRHHLVLAYLGAVSGLLAAIAAILTLAFR